MEMQEFRAFAKHMMYMEEYSQRIRLPPCTECPHDQHNPSMLDCEGDKRVQSWQNYQGNIFKRQRLPEPPSIKALKPSVQLSSEVRTPGFNGGESSLDRKFLPPVQVKPPTEEAPLPADSRLVKSALPPPISKKPIENEID